MILSWLDASEAKKFGESLAHYFMEKTPAIPENKTSKFAVKKQEELLTKMSQQLVRFKLEHKLNIYKKAQIGNSFKWKLKDAGYDSVYVDQMTSWLMVKI